MMRLRLVNSQPERGVSANHGAGPLGMIVRLLDILSWALLVTGGGGALMMVLLLALGHRPYVELPVALAIHSAVGKASVVDASGTLDVKAPAAVSATVVLVVAAVLGLLLVVMRQVRALLADIAGGSPFGSQSARRVQVIGATIIAADLGRALVVLLASLWAQGHVHLQGLDFVASFPVQIDALGAGILLVILAEVFRRGADLQHDYDLTI